MTSVLWISKETPDVRGQGGQRRQYFQIRELVRAGASVSAVLARGEQDPASLRALAEVHQFGGRWPKSRRSVSPAAEVLSGKYDRIVVAHAESFELIESCPEALACPSLLDFHNVNSRWYRALGDERLVEFWDRSESKIMARLDMVLTCSENELCALPEGTAQAHIAPNGVELTEWPWTSSPRQANRLVAFGSWWYPSNRKGLEWFLDHVWPLIRDKAPSAQLLLAGSGTPPMSPATSEGVEHIGRVDDIAAFLRAAAVIVMPVIHSPGTPVKFAEALAAGSPLVATPGAGDGFPNSPAVLTQDPGAFADACLRFLSDRVVAESVARDGRNYAEQHCTWSRTQLPLVTWVEEPS